MSAANDLLQLQQHPTYYDHLPKVEAAIAEQDRVAKLRREDFKWEPDEDQWIAPDPLDPTKQILEEDWENTTGLPLPEDMGPLDHVKLDCMKLFAQEVNPYDGIAAVVDKLHQMAKTGWGRP
ncbi:MAG: hypothetical protein VKL39_24765 [Leptolyngbyaceae bacterium]|nr:hypothetical protein [Leptolyngbyaceae bacterium]